MHPSAAPPSATSVGTVRGPIVRPRQRLRRHRHRHLDVPRLRARRATQGQHVPAVPGGHVQLALRPHVSHPGPSSLHLEAPTLGSLARLPPICVPSLGPSRTPVCSMHRSLSTHHSFASRCLHPDVLRQCTPCPSHTSSCVGGQIAVAPGYWRPSPLSTVFLACPFPKVRRGCVHR